MKLLTWLQFKIFQSHVLIFFIVNVNVNLFGLLFAKISY